MLIYTYWYKIHRYFFQALTNDIQPLAQRPYTSCRELPKFVREVLYSFQEHLAKHRNKVCFHSCDFTCIGKFYLCQAVHMLHLYSVGYSLANRHKKDLIVMQVDLLA